MTNTIFYQDKAAIETDLYPYERKVWLLNLLIERMNQVGYPIETTEQIAEVLTAGAEKYIRNRIVSTADFNVGGIKLNKSALLDVVEIPDLSEVQSTERLIKEYHMIPLTDLEFDEGKFNVPNELIQRTVDKRTVYAQTAKQVEIYKEAKKVVKAVNDFKKKHGPQTVNGFSTHPFRFPDQYIHWNVKTFEFEVDYRHILNHSK